MVDPGIIAIGLAGLVAIERIFSRIRESRCMGVHIRNNTPPSTPAPVSEPVELGPVIGSGHRRLPSPPPKESSPR